MTNWPNIQEYRNFEGSFYNDSMEFEGSNEATGNGEMESIRTNKVIGFEDGGSGHIGKLGYQPESKTVRCVIRKDFEENFKKLDRGDGLVVGQQEVNNVKCQDANKPATISSCASGMTTDRRSIADQVRLENHLKWKKQKEEEYLRRKMAEKMALEKEKEEKARLEKLKKHKEKEREAKLKEWMQQKEREKEGKKREKIVMKALEEELKEVAPVINKEKLIEDWVKLKDKQRQIEAEKKAEILKREEESRALRQSLAALSYRQWKEKVKGKNTILPKNGYQIFAPKPVPVVKEDWNHDFIRNSPRRRMIGLVGSKSTTTTNIMTSPLSQQTGLKELENHAKDLYQQSDLKIRSPSFYHLKNIKSGSDLMTSTGMPLKELQSGILGTKKTCLGSTKAIPTSRTYNCSQREMNNGLSHYSSRKTSGLHNPTAANFSLPFNFEDRNFCLSPSRIPDSNKQNDNDVRAKKKIDLYIDPLPIDKDDDDDDGVDDEDYLIKFHKKPTAGNVKSKEKKNVLENKTNVGGDKIYSKKTFVPVSKKSEATRVCSEAQINRRSCDLARHTVKRSVHPAQPGPSKSAKVNRRSKSCEKPQSKASKENIKGKSCAVSRSLMKLSNEKKGSGTEAKTKTSSSHKRRVRKSPKPVSAGGVEKKGILINTKSSSKLNENSRRNNNVETNSPKKPKKKITKSFSFIDSPYNSVKKNSSKNQSKKKSTANKDGGCVKTGEPEKWPKSKIS